MKKIVAVVFFTWALCQVTAQVEIRNYTGLGGTQVGNDISGTVFSVDAVEPGPIIQHFAIKNVFGSDQYLGIKRLRINVPTDWTDQITWGQDPDELFEGSCYSPNQMTSNPWSSPNAIGTNHLPTIEDQNIGDLWIQINVQSSGTGLYRYYIMTQQGFALDSIDLQINASSVGLNNQKKNEGIVLYPNPANDILKVNATFGIDFVLKITDLNGNKVFDEQVTYNDIDVSHFQNGVYLMSFYRDDELVETQMLVIKR